MKKIIAITLMAFAGLNLQAGSPKPYFEAPENKSESLTVGITFFEGTWAEALAKSKEDDKLIFLDAYASWCGPCKRMAAYTFTDEKVGAYFNEHFISYKMDMEKHAEGPRLSQKYSLTAYPTLYFINSDESVAHQTLGYHDPAKLIAVGETVTATKKK
ncbi:MAG: thioredoxin family protein [Crocinitomicaceae bacterium]|nr:thioredoxin family protein [Crocinitomicaceae bacterium]